MLCSMWTPTTWFAANLNKNRCRHTQSVSSTCVWRCGASCLGYRYALFRVIYQNIFGHEVAVDMDNIDNGILRQACACPELQTRSCVWVYGFQTQHMMSVLLILRAAADTAYYSHKRGYPLDDVRAVPWTKTIGSDLRSRSNLQLFHTTTLNRLPCTFQN